MDNVKRAKFIHHFPKYKGGYISSSSPKLFSVYKPLGSDAYVYIIVYNYTYCCVNTLYFNVL